jgi:hypothetical protein
VPDKRTRTHQNLHFPKRTSIFLLIRWKKVHEVEASSQDPPMERFDPQLCQILHRLVCPS